MSEFSHPSLEQQFQDAIADLWWMSETDAPFELEVWPDAFSEGFSISELLQQTEHDPEISYEESSLDRLFEPAIQMQDWHGELEKQDVQRFRHLKSLILDNLSTIKVVRVGEVNLDIYILGKTETQTWFVLSTQAVET